MAEAENFHQLLTRLKHGYNANDREEFLEIGTLLYARYAGAFYRYATRRRGLTHEEAEDAVSAIVLKILSRISSYDDEVKRGGSKWLWTICENHISDILRDPDRSRRGELPSDLFAPDESEPEWWLERWERNRAFHRALERISPQYGALLLEDRRRGPRSEKWHKAAELFRKVYLEEREELAT